MKSPENSTLYGEKWGHYWPTTIHVPCKRKGNIIDYHWINVISRSMSYCTILYRHVNVIKRRPLLTTRTNSLPRLPLKEFICSGCFAAFWILDCFYTDGPHNLLSLLVMPTLCMRSDCLFLNFRNTPLITICTIPYQPHQEWGRSRCVLIPCVAV